MLEWQGKNTNLINKAQDHGVKSIHAKLETFAMRLALILHMIHYATDEVNS